MLEDDRFAVDRATGADTLLLAWATLYLLSALQTPLDYVSVRPIQQLIGVVITVAFGLGLAAAVLRDLDPRWYAVLGALEATNVVALLGGGVFHVGWFANEVVGPLAALVTLGSLTVVLVLYGRALGAPPASSGGIGVEADAES